MKALVLKALAGTGLALIAANPAAAATLDLTGASVTATLLFPDTTVYAGPFTTTVGAGTEFPFGTFAPANGSLDITATTITFFANVAATYSTASFNGYRLDFINYTGDLGSLALAASSSFAPFDFDVVGDSVFLNLQGQTVTATDSITLATVPEPASWAMMIGGFGLVGGALRRRQSQVRVTYA